MRGHGNLYLLVKETEAYSSVLFQAVYSIVHEVYINLLSVQEMNQSAYKNNLAMQ